MAGSAIQYFYRNFKAIVVRAIFILHASLSIYMLRVNNNFESIHWLLMLPLAFIVLDGVYVIYFKSGMEMEFFWTTGFFYILSIVPIVWIIELGLLKDRKETRGEKSAVSNNLADWLGVIDKDALSKNWAEIGIFICLIAGRWFMPRSNLSREQLSTLLLGYIGNAADILDLFNSLETPGVVYEKSATIAVLAMYTLAVIQFSLITTSSFEEIRQKKVFEKCDDSQQETGAQTATGNSESYGNVKYTPVPQQLRQKVTTTRAQEDERCHDECQCYDEFYQIFVTLLMHDGPFLLLRLTLCIKYNVITELHIFFLVKNGMVIFLLVYRVVVLSFDCKHYIFGDTLKRNALVNQLHKTSDVCLHNAVTCAVAVAVGEGDNSLIVHNEDQWVDIELDSANNPIVDAEERDSTIVDMEHIIPLPEGDNGTIVDIEHSTPPEDDNGIENTTPPGDNGTIVDMEHTTPPPEGDNGTIVEDMGHTTPPKGENGTNAISAAKKEGPTNVHKDDMEATP